MSQPLITPDTRFAVYVAAPLTLLAQAKDFVAELERNALLRVCSSWHRGEPTVEEDQRHLRNEWSPLGDTCLQEIDRADALVLLYGPPTDRKGNVFEAGYALGRNKAVFVCAAQPGRASWAVAPEIPTALLWSRRVAHHDVRFVEHVLGHLARAEALRRAKADAP